MPRILQLPPHVVSRIAAGEVIERPASVLKELMENSIDAGGTRIDVEVVNGGLDTLRVTDDGCGIAAEDLPLAFAAHATSKLRDAADLDSVGTLGFRGEGLASVAQVLLQSWPGDSAHGAEVRCDGGRLSDVRPWAGTPGTRVEVRHLFYDTPARRKFLRGPGPEMGHVTEAFIRLALSQLALHLKLSHNARVTYDVPASAGLLDRVGLFFGDGVRRHLLPVEAEGGGLTLGGYVAGPACESGGAGAQYLFVNGRWVRDWVLSQALQEAYAGLLMAGKQPVAFLFLDVPHDSVDVNVHPTKSEVRFRRSEKVRQFVADAVRQSLRGADLTAALRAPKASAPAAVTPEGVQKPAAVAEAPPRPAAADRPPAPRPSPPAPQAARQPVARVEPPARRPPKAVQMQDAYLVVEEGDGILIIDQHALHERFLFERLKAGRGQGRLESQRLLVPEPVTLPPAQAALLLEHRDALHELGLEVDGFGGGTVLLGGYPAALGKRQPRDILRAVAGRLAEREGPPDRGALLDGLLALVACHSAVRAGDRLSPEEIQELLAQRHLAQDSHHCPHGRPTSLLLTKHDLDQQFGRHG